MGVTKLFQILSLIGLVSFLLEFLIPGVLFVLFILFILLPIQLLQIE